MLIVVGEWKIEFYQIDEDNSPVLDWFKVQKPKVKAKIGRIFDLLEEQGTAVGMPYVKPLEEKLYEIRVEQNTNYLSCNLFCLDRETIYLASWFSEENPKNS